MFLSKQRYHLIFVIFLIFSSVFEHSASKDKQSTTQSGISHGTTITLTDPTKQALITGQSAEQYLATINRNVTTNIDTSGALERVYDEASIKASMNIAKEFREEAGVFSNNRNRETDAAKKLQEGLNEKGRDHWTAEDHKAFDQASKVIENNKFWTNGGTGKQILTGLSLAATGNATGSTGAFIRDAAVNVIQGMAAGKIKDIADQLDSETARALLHSIAGCAGAAAKQGDCASGAMGAGAAVVLNNLLDQLQGIDKSNLTEAEKENRVNIITGLIAGITDAVGGEGAMAGAAAQIEMENNEFGNLVNYFNPGEGYLQNTQVEQKLTSQCAQGDSAACQNLQEFKHKVDTGTLIYKVGDTVLDITPFIGTGKAMYEAETTLDYILALGPTVVPGVAGVAVSKFKKASKLAGAGKVDEANNLLKEVNNELRSKKGAIVFFENSSYSSKVLAQMSKTDDIYHAFPKSIDGYATKYGTWTTKTGKDGKPYQWLEVPGKYKGKVGTFEYIKDANGEINHRFFNTSK